jgi:hypothetical protein
MGILTRGSSLWLLMRSLIEGSVAWAPGQEVEVVHFEVAVPGLHRLRGL